MIIAFNVMAAFDAVVVVVVAAVVVAVFEATATINDLSVAVALSPLNAFCCWLSLMPLMLWLLLMLL